MGKIPGLICLIVGGMLLYWGYHISQTIGSQINNLVNGTPSDKSMLFYIGGVILVLAGLGQVAWKRK